MEFWIFYLRRLMIDNVAFGSLVYAVRPQFRAALIGVDSTTAAKPAMVTAATPAAVIGSGLIDHLAGPVLRLAADLILQRVRREAQVVLDAEKAAHPGLDLAIIQRFIDSLGAATVEDGV